MSECPSAIPFGALATEYHTQVGGKCASLGVMSQAGLPVPPGFAVTTPPPPVRQPRPGPLLGVGLLGRASVRWGRFAFRLLRCGSPGA